MDTDRYQYAARPSWATWHVAGRILVVVLTVMRYTLFYPLMWLRMLIVPLTHACAFLTLIGLVLAAVLFPDRMLLWRLGLFSFGAFAAGWAYDGVLLLLSPRPLVLTTGRADRWD